MKPTKEPRVKKPRVWKAWGVTCSKGHPTICKNRSFARILCKAWKSAFPSTSVVRVTITERKPEKKHKHKFDRCYDLVHKAGAAHVEYCQCGKKKP